MSISGFDGGGAAGTDHGHTHGHHDDPAHGVADPARAEDEGHGHDGHHHEPGGHGQASDSDAREAGRDAGRGRRRSRVDSKDEAHGQGGEGHSHARIAGDAGALTVVGISSLGLAVVAAVELVAAALTSSAAVLADGLHNLGDVATTVALAAAFILSRRAPSRRFPFGYHRGEDLAGLLVLLLIVGSAVVSGITSLDHLVHRPPLGNLGLALGSALFGFAGNELVAQYKVTAGRRLHSLALVADGKHSRIDGIASLGAAAGVIGAGLGVPVLDPIAGLVITVVIVTVAWETAREVTGRLLDAADASLLAEVEAAAAGVDGIDAVADVRARWTGRRVWVELTVEVPSAETVGRAHALAEEVRHRLFHRVDALAGVVVHLDPADDDAAHQLVAHHER